MLLFVFVFVLVFVFVIGSVVPKMKITNVLNTSALAVRVFTPDTVAPACLTFDLHLNPPEQLIIYFSEPVREDSLFLPSMFVRNKLFKVDVSFSTFNRQVQLIKHTQVIVNISSRDIYYLKFILHTGGLTNEIFFNEQAVFDFSGNYMLGNGVGQSLPNLVIPIRQFIADTSKPIVLTSVLDLGLGTLTLQYNEPIDTSVLLPAYIVLLPYADYSYLNESASYFPNITASGNSNISSNVNSSMLDSTLLAEVVISVNKSGIAIQLTEYTLVGSGTNYAVVADLGLYQHDLNILKEQTRVGTSVNNTFVAIYGVSDIFGNLISQTQIFQLSKFVPDESLLLVQAFDYLPHVYSGNSGNANTDKTIINVYFANTVDVSTFNCSQLQFSTSPYIPATLSVSKLPILRLSQCQVESVENAHFITVNILSSYFASFEPVSKDTSNQNLYLSIPTVDKLASTLSTSGRSLAVIPLTQAIQAGTRILKFTVNMNTRKIVFIFSKQVQLLTGNYNHSNLGFYSSLTKFSFFCPSNTSQQSALEPFQSSVAAGFDQLTSYNDSIAALTLSVDEMNSMKELDVSQSSLSLLVSNHFLRDVTGVWVAPQPLPDSTLAVNRQLLHPIKFVADNVRPRIVSFDYNDGLHALQLHFDEPIRGSTVVVTQIALMSSNYSLDALDAVNAQYMAAHNITQLNVNQLLSFQLTGGTAFSQGLTVTIILSAVDSANIKLNPNLFKFANNTFIAFPATFLADMAGNAVFPQVTGLGATSYTKNTVGPVLVSFTLNMHDNLLIIVFNGPVDVSSFDATAIQLQSRFFSRNGVYYALTGGSIIASDLFSITVQLTAADVLAIKLIDGLCRSQASTYMIASANMIRDLNGNAFQPVTDTFAHACDVFISDTIAPRVTHQCITTLFF